MRVSIDIEPFVVVLRIAQVMNLGPSQCRRHIRQWWALRWCCASAAWHWPANPWFYSRPSCAWSPFRDGDASKHELGIEPRVFLDLSNGDPLLWVIGQHFLQQILAFLVIANAAPGVVLPEFIEIGLGQRTEPSIAVMRLLKGRVKINNTTPILKMSQAKS